MVKKLPTNIAKSSWLLEKTVLDQKEGKSASHTGLDCQVSFHAPEEHVGIRLLKLKSGIDLLRIILLSFIHCLVCKWVL